MSLDGGELCNGIIWDLVAGEAAHAEPAPPIAVIGRIDEAGTKVQIARDRGTSGRRRPVVPVRTAVVERTTVVAGEQEVSDGTSTSIVPEGRRILVISTL